MASVGLFGSKRGEMETTRASVVAICPGTCTRRMAGSFLWSRGSVGVSSANRRRLRRNQKAHHVLDRSYNHCIVIHGTCSKLKWKKPDGRAPLSLRRYRRIASSSKSLQRARGRDVSIETGNHHRRDMAALTCEAGLCCCDAWLGCVEAVAEPPLKSSVKPSSKSRNASMDASSIVSMMGSISSILVSVNTYTSGADGSTTTPTRAPRGLIIVRSLVANEEKVKEPNNVVTRGDFSTFARPQLHCATMAKSERIVKFPRPAFASQVAALEWSFEVSLRCWRRRHNGCLAKITWISIACR